MLVLRSLIVSLVLVATGASAASAAPPTLKPVDARITEGDEGTRIVRVGIALARPARKTARVSFATRARTAGLRDFAAKRGTVRIRRGARRASIAVRVTGDRLVEGDERFVVQLTRPRGARLGRRAKAASVTITDDDGPGTGPARTPDPADRPYPIGFNDAIGPPPVVPEVAFDDAAVVEPATAGSTSPHRAAIRLSRSTTVPVTVRYAAVPQTATVPGDLAMVDGTVTIPAGQTEQPLPGTAVGDALDEDDETVKIVLSNPRNATIADPDGLLKVLDDPGDVAPAVTVGDKTRAESAGTGSVQVPVTLSAPSGRSVSVRVRTQNGAAKSGLLLDYLGVDTTVTFEPGEIGQFVPVTVIDDARDEDDQAFDVLLSEPANATLGDATAAVTITDDDPPPTLSVDDALIVENDTTVTFGVSLSAASDKPIEFNFATTAVTATGGVSCSAGKDYVSASIVSIDIPAGQTSEQVSVSICEDATNEVDETFSAALSVPWNATLGDASATATIQDDD